MIALLRFGIGLAAVLAFILMVTLAQQIGVWVGHGLAPWNLP